MPTIQFKRSNTPGAVPSSLAQGEIAINYADQKAWVGNASGTPVRIIGSLGNQEPSSVAITGGSVSVSNFGTSTPATAAIGTVAVGGTSMTTVRSSDQNTDTVSPVSGDGAYYSSDKLRGRLKNVYTWSSSGTYTYIKSGPDVKTVHVLCCGGGGGARAYSEGGGAGGFSEGIYDATGISTVTVTVGGGGGGGVYFGFSGQGGSSSFGGYISCSGGYGSSNNESHSGGHGGYGYGGSINTYGGMGSSHTNDDQYSPSNSSEGQGGASYFGGSMMADRPDFANGNPGPGAPGAGGIPVSPGHNGQGGRNGQVGCVIVYEYI